MDQPNGFCLLYECLRANRFDLAERMIAAGCDKNAGNWDGGDVIAELAGTNNIPALEFMLNHGANPNGSPSVDWLPLHYAAEQNALDAIRMLLQHGADPHKVSDGGVTAMYHARSPECRALLQPNQ